MFIFATAANASAQSTVDYVENQSVIAGSPSVNVVGLSSKTRFISNEVIKETVENSIKKAELFSGGENKVRVNLTILNIEIPFIGLNGTAEIRIRWQLISDDDKSFIFQSEIFSDHRNF